MSVLSAERLSIAFGGVRAVDDVSFDVAPGIVFSIIGPNGAGKTTLFNLISGICPPNDGRVRLCGEDVTALAPEQLARRGLSRTFQSPQIFSHLTAIANVMIGRHRHEATGIIADLLHLPAVGRQNRRTRADAARLPRSQHGCARGGLRDRPPRRHRPCRGGRRRRQRQLTSSAPRRCLTGGSNART